MAVKIYYDTNPSAVFSVDGSMSNPLKISADGQNGSIIENKYYVRNDNFIYEYENVTVQPVRLGGKDIISDLNGYNWKIIAGDTQPSESQWSNTLPASAVNLGDLLNTTTYLPFWLRTTIPRGAITAVYNQCTLKITATQS